MQQVGSEFTGETVDEYSKKEKEELVQYKLPFGGGAGAGASINPVAFLVVQNGTARLLPIEHNSCVDRLMDYVPDLMQKVNEMFNKNMKTQNEKTEKIVEEIRKKSEKNNFNQNLQTKDFNAEEVEVHDSKIDDFEPKEFEEKENDAFNLKHHISVDVNQDINSEVKQENPESDGEDF